MSSTTIAIAGFTGKLAQLITASLLAKPNVIIHGIARNPAKVPKEVAGNPRVRVFEADASADSIDKVREAIRGTSIVICCYLGDDSVLIDGQKFLIDAAIAEKVPRYLSSDYSFDFRGLKLDDISQKNFQLVINDYLAQKEAKGLIKAVHVLNGAFIEVMFSPFMQVFDLGNKSLNVWGSGDEKFQMSTYEDTARFTAEVALDPNTTGYMKLVSDSVSIKEIRAAYQDVYGEQLTTKNHGTKEQLLETAKEQQAKNPEQWFMWIGLLFTYYMSNGATWIDGDDRSRYGLEITDLKAFLKAHSQEELPKLMGF